MVRKIVSTQRRLVLTANEGFMELTERKAKIIEAIIKNYQKTGEPVGSRTISKDTDLNVSSATIRNEMADLEEMGLIMSPHTSAGRVPTDLAYRMYVEKLMSPEELEMIPQPEKNELVTQDFLLKRVDRVELMLEQLVKVVAANTNYAAMASAPRVNANKLKFLQLSRVDNFKLLLVAVVEGDIVRNTFFDSDYVLSDEEILSLNLLLNNCLAGKTLDEISLADVNSMNDQAGPHRWVVAKVVEALGEALRRDDEVKVYTSGATNIFRYPELADADNAGKIIGAFEDKEKMAQFLAEGYEGADLPDGIRIYIGDEAPMESMKDCSVVTTTYELANGLKGKIGIVGPKRMDYEKVVGTLQTVMAQLNVIGRGQEVAAEENIQERE